MTLSGDGRLLNLKRSQASIDVERLSCWRRAAEYVRLAPQIYDHRTKFLRLTYAAVGGALSGIDG